MLFLSIKPIKYMGYSYVVQCHFQQFQFPSTLILSFFFKKMDTNNLAWFGL